MKKKLPLLLVLIAFFQFSTAQSNAEYDISFTSTWSDVTHPDPNFPSNAHWSDLVGATHNSSVVFVAMGQLATPGIKDVAELGNNNNFQAEVTAAQNDNTADRWLQEPFSPFAAISTATMTDILVSEDFPLLSLAAMIAPSPDWMIAVNSLSLVDAQGDWIPSIILDLYPYDAGTDNGTHYSSGNAPNPSPDPISSLQNVSPFSNEKAGTLTITLKRVLSNDAFAANRLEIYPNPSRNGRIQIRNASALASGEVYNVLGKRVKTLSFSGNSEMSIDMSDMNSGVYILRAADQNGATLTRKIVLQ